MQTGHSTSGHRRGDWGLTRKTWTFSVLAVGGAMALLGTFAAGALWGTAAGPVPQLLPWAVAALGVAMAAAGGILAGRRFQPVRPDATAEMREAVLSRVVNSIPGRVFRLVMDDDGGLTFPVFLGVSRTGLILEGQRVLRSDLEKLIHPEDRLRWFDAVETAIRDVAPFELEFRAFNHHGQETWNWSRGVPCPQQDGTVALDCVSLDVTDRKRMEQELSDNLALLQNVAANVPGYVYRRVRRSDGTYYMAYVSEDPLGLLGHAVPDVLADESMRGANIHPDDRPDRDVALEASARDMAPYSFEFRRILADGSIRWVRSAGTPRSGPGGEVIWDGIALDITALKDAEAALKDHQNLLQGIIDRMPGYIYRRIRHPDGTMEVPFVSQGPLGVIDKSDPDNQTTFYCIASPVHPEDEPAHQEAYRRSAATMTSFSDEFRRILPDGSIRWIRSTASIRQQENGDIAWDGLALDITELKEAQRALAESEAQLRAILDNAPVIISLKDTDGRYLILNRHHEQLLGMEAGQGVGATVQDLFGPAIAKDVARVEAEVTAGQKPSELEVLLPAADGQTRVLLETKFPVMDGDGTVLGLGTIGLDVTDRKRAETALRVAEERFRQFAEIASDWMWESDENHRYTFVSQRREDAFGIPNSEMIGRTREEIAEVSVDTPEWRRLRADLAAHRPFRNFTNQRRDSKGRLRVTTISGRPVFHADGTFRGYRGTARDVTEEHDREAQLIQAQKMQAIGELTGGIAHDFNNLLGVVLTNLDLVAEMVGNDSEAAELVERAIRATMRGADLTRSLVAFARKQSLRAVDTDINQLVVDLVDMLGRTLGETVEVSSCLAPGLWPALVDPAQLESAIINLAVNARDAMPEGGSLTIETGNVVLGPRIPGQTFKVRPGDYVRLVVRDSGDGIDREVLSQVFQPFFTTKEVGRGSGLGLSMVFGFVKQSNGYVTVTSAPNVGTEAALYLPRSEEAEVADVAAVGIDAAPKGDVTSGNGESILLVEDEESVRRVVSDILTDLNYKVKEVRDGQAAIVAMTEEGRPNLLFTDIVLPGRLDGWGVAAEARERWSDLPVIFTSGYAGSGNRFQDDRNAGYVGKPFRKAQLAREVRRLLDRDMAPAAEPSDGS